MIKKFDEFLNESNKDNFILGDYEFWADKQYGDDRKPHYEYYIVYGKYEGHLTIEKGDHGGESYKYLDYIEWDDETPENSDEIEEFVENNLYEIMKKATVI